VSSAGQRDHKIHLVLLGPPGAGKGTQAKILAEALGLAHIASGDLFRYHQRKGTPLGLKAVEYMSQGLLVPDEITIAMVLEQDLLPVGGRAFLLDGFPRNYAQAQALDENLAGRGQHIDRAMLIKVSQDELVRRLSGRLVCRQCQAPYHEETAPPKTPGKCDLCGGELYQRQDDTPEAVRVRIRVYEAETEPLIGHYRRAGKLAEVDGVGTVEEVGQRLLGALQDGAGVQKKAELS
jgi:adenylate kinase